MCVMDTTCPFPYKSLQLRVAGKQVQCDRESGHSSDMAPPKAIGPTCLAPFTRLCSQNARPWD